MIARASLVLAATLLVGASCSSGADGGSHFDATRAAIVKGAPAASRAETVALAKGDTLVCTGVLIDSRVVLTAAHCIDDLRAELDVVSGPSLGSSSSRIAITDRVIHPGWDVRTRTDDLALVFLARPLAGVSAATLGDAADAAGAVARIVGYGKTLPKEGEVALATKHEGLARVASVEPGTLTLGPEPSITCSGDSGGPVFLDGSGALVAITSSGDCATRTVGTRIDTRRAFVDRALALALAADLGPGARCVRDDQCRSGLCLPAPDAPRRACAAPCAGSCPDGLVCEGDGCRPARPSFGAVGGACLFDEDCESAICVNGPTGSVCARPCLSSIGATCGEGACARVVTTSTRSVEACMQTPPREGGCSLARRRTSRRGPELAWVVSAAAAWLRRRAGRPSPAGPRGASPQ